MSKLLHSKTFRKNLYKWLFMYICALLVISTVVTYSRYITKNSLGDEARAAKFEVTINEEKICLNSEEYPNMSEDELCSNIKNNDNYKIKPYDTLEYYFTIDSTNLDVLSDNIIYISLDNKYTLTKIYKKVDSNWEEITLKSVITEEVGASKKGKTAYKLIIKPNEIVNNNNESKNIINISYTYIQKTD